MSPQFKEQEDMVGRFVGNMEVMFATLEVLEKTTTGKLTGKEAMAQLEIIREKLLGIQE